MTSSAMQSKSIDEELFEFDSQEIETSLNEASTTTTIQPIISTTTELPKKLVTDIDQIEEELTEISSQEFETTTASVIPTTTTTTTTLFSKFTAL